MHARQVAARERQVAGLQRADGQTDRVVLRAQRLERDVAAHLDTGAEDDALGDDLIEAPVDVLAAILVDYPHVPDWAPASRDFEILEHSGDEYVISGVTAIPWPISDRHWHMRSVSGWESVDGRDVFVYRFQYIPGTGNIEDSNGYWLLMPMPDEPDVTYVRYVVHADPGLAIPNVIIRWVTRSALPDLIDGLRERHHELH